MDKDRIWNVFSSCVGDDIWRDRQEYSQDETAD